MPYDAALAARPPHAGGWRAALSLGFQRRGDRTTLAERHQDGPLALQKVLYPEGGHVCHGIVLHPPGGIAGGDALRIALRVGPGAHVLATTPGATRWYRANGRAASQDVTLDVGAGASVEWLPLESIVFDGARAAASLEIRLDSDARAIAWDIACLGRTASGESFSKGWLKVHTGLWRGEHLVWRERGEIDAADPWIRAASGLGAASVVGTMMVAAPSIHDAWLGLARSHRPRRGEGACTRLPGVLLARYRGDSTEAAREYFTAIWRDLREALLGRAAIEPRIWRT